MGQGLRLIKLSESAEALRANSFSMHVKSRTEGVRETNHVGVHCGLLNVAGNAGHKSIAIFKVGVEVGLLKEKQKHINIQDI